MTERQKRFCAFYKAGMSKKKAAVAAGYGEKGALATGARLLALDEVQEELKQDSVFSGSIADNAEILSFFTEVLRSSDDSVAVRDKMRAAELLGKNLSLFSDKGELMTPVEIYGEGEIKE